MKELARSGAEPHVMLNTPESRTLMGVALIVPNISWSSSGGPRTTGLGEIVTSIAGPETGIARPAGGKAPS